MYTNITTIKDAIEEYKNVNLAEVFVFEQDSRTNAIHGFHGDFIKDIYDGEWTDDMEATAYARMNENEFNGSVNANSELLADFEEWYEDKNATVLVITTNKMTEKGFFIEELGGNNFDVHLFDDYDLAYKYECDRRKSLSPSADVDFYTGTCIVDPDGKVDWDRYWIHSGDAQYFDEWVFPFLPFDDIEFTSDKEI